jgi:hypothetical protein
MFATKAYTKITHKVSKNNSKHFCSAQFLSSQSKKHVPKKFRGKSEYGLFKISYCIL